MKKYKMKKNDIKIIDKNKMALCITIQSKSIFRRIQAKIITLLFYPFIKTEAKQDEKI